MNLNQVVVVLKTERDRLDKAIAALSGVAGSNGVGGGTRRRLSAAARERIAAAQRKRWAKVKAGKKG